MRTSRKLTHYLMAVFAVAMMSMAALAADPGTLMPQTSEASDQKAGSLLVYTVYQSSATNIASNDTKINLTNTNDSNPIIVHFFFVGACSVADFKTELTANQTYSFLTSDVDPGTNGYIIAIAENYLGIPIHFNYLIGDLFLKNSTNSSNIYNANLGAIAFSALWDREAMAALTTDASSRTINVSTGARLRGSEIPAASTTLALNAASSVSLGIAFNGSTPVLSGSGGSIASYPQANYNLLPSTLALSNIPSRASNDRTLVTVFSPTGSLVTAPASAVTVFGLLFDDAEQSQSFSLAFTCGQTLLELSNTTPRTVPRFDSVIPAGRSGWMKIWNSAQVGILGSMIVYNQQVGLNFAGGHNLHHLTLTTNSGSGSSSSPISYPNLTVPVFPFTGN